MSKTSIEWTEDTWNSVTGCTKKSAGCKNCYAEGLTRRLKAMGQEKYKDGFNVVTPHPETLELPYKWGKPRMVFVNSMSDTLHEDVPTEFIQQNFKVMEENPEHTFQILTKRSERLSELSEELNWPMNVWMGVTVENEQVKYRIERLRQTSAKLKFLSIEPLLEDLGDINLEGIDWVIVGGESGNRARPMREEWVQNILRQCKEQNVPFFFKQWGTWGSDGVKRNKKANGRLLNGRTYDEMPKTNN